MTRPVRRLLLAGGLVAAVTASVPADDAAPATGPVTPATRPAANPATNPSTAPAAPATTAPGEPDSTTTRPTTAPATSPTTSPTTRSAALDAAIDAAVRGLEAGGWRDRERHKADLVRAGEDAVPALERFVRRTESIDARTAAQDALNQIAGNRVIGPSFVTLHLTDAHPRDAFAALGRQAFTELRPYPDNLWDNLAPPPVSVDADRQPFWVVMRDLAGKTGVELREINGGLRLMRGSGAMNAGRPLVSGAFLVVASQVSRNSTVTLTEAGVGQASENFGVQFTVFAEPKLTVVKASPGIKLDAVVDDKGNSLIPDAEDGAAGGVRRFGFGYAGGSAGSWTLTAPLKYPKDPGTRITRFRGSATFTVQTRSQRLEIPNLTAVNDSVHALGGMRVTVREFKKEGSLWQLKLVVANGQLAGGGGPLGWDQLQTSINTRLKVLDAAGNALDRRSWGSSGGMNETEVTLSFAAGRMNDLGKPTGDPVKLVWEVPVETKELTVPIEFDDLPMPR